jgi:hypothetical protein
MPIRDRGLGSPGANRPIIDALPHPSHRTRMHTRAKISLSFWAIACALATILVLAFRRYEFEILVIAALGLLLLVGWRLWAVRQLRGKQELNTQHRLEELQREVSLLGRPVRIDGMDPTLLLVFGVVISLLLNMMHRGTGKAWPLVFAVLMAIAVLLAVAVRISKLGQPLLIVSREGVQPAGYGLLPWSAVYGIACHKVGDHHASRLVLNIYVPELKAQVASAQWFIRLFHAVPGLRRAKYQDVIMVPMRKPSELPAVIERLCRNVWQEATGRKHLWNIDLSGSQTQFNEMIRDVSRQQQACANTDALEPLRADMQNLTRYAQRANEDAHGRTAWMRIWTVPGSIAFGLFMIQVPLGRLIGFVATDTWSGQALGMAAVLAIIAWIALIRHARHVFGERFTRVRIAQVLATLAIASLLVVPMTWFLITDLGGAMAGYGSDAPYEELTVIATKAERTSRRGCDHVLRHPGLGKSMCLTYAEFLSFPEQVPVVISIRRNALGYRVYERRIALAGG